MKVTSIVDNLSKTEGIKAESALSLLIEYQNKKILLDTSGSSSVFLNNVKKLNINLSEIDYCIVSHLHFDHTGGLGSFMKENTKSKVYLSDWKDYWMYFRGFCGFLKKYIGPRDSEIFEKEKDRFVFCEKTTKVCDGVFVITSKSFKRNHPKPTVNYLLYTWDAFKGYVQDEFLHEIALVIFSGDDKMNVFSSCSHNGILNIVEAAKKEFPERKVGAVVGGFHYKTLFWYETEENIKYVADEMVKLNVEKVVTMHCTSEWGYEVMKKKFKGKVTYLYGGKTIVL